MNAATMLNGLSNMRFDTIRAHVGELYVDSVDEDCWWLKPSFVADSGV